VFSLSPGMWAAYLGAVGFGAAAAFTLAAGMGALQSQLDGHERVLAFAAFHVVIRVALSLAAVGAGLATAALGAVTWPLVGRVEPARVVLLCSGLLVGASAAAVVERRGAACPSPSAPTAPPPSQPSSSPGTRSRSCRCGSRSAGSRCGRETDRSASCW